jgi:mono/diheme cytochrome c family protein
VYASAVPLSARLGLEPLQLHLPVFGMAVVFYLLALGLVRRGEAAGPGALGLILGFALVFRLLLAWTPGYLSSDPYQYLWDYTGGFLTVGALTIVHAMPAGRRARVLLVVLGEAAALGAVGPARASEEAGAQTLVAEGQGWWTRSPDPTHPVACATCHHDSGDVRGWAAGFPKVRPLPPPHTRVMTFLQANAEAVARHYRLQDPRAAATAITAYLTALGADLPVSPGLSPGQPVFPQRLRQLEASVGRGAAVFSARCAACHRPAGVASVARAFPRMGGGQPQTPEMFLMGHRPSGRALDWSDPEMADLVAYLVSHLSGRPVGVRVEPTRKETP